LNLENSNITSELSSKTEDLEWDAFLQGSPLGQFQQSGAWAKYKQTEDWNTLRSVLKSGNEIVGGFQILWKQTKWGKIAYVSKGPVLHPRFTALSKSVLNQLQSIASDRGFRAMIVQPPNDDSSFSDKLKTNGFLRGDCLNVIESTLLVDVSVSALDAMRRIRSSSRKKYNKAIRNGLTVREGEEKDLNIFFDLMQETCNRQKTVPNPPSEKAVEALWSSFSPQNQIRLTFSTFKDETVSGLLFISFGKRLSLLKTGWNGQYREYFPNNLLTCDAIQWACDHDFEIADFVGINKNITTSLLQVGTISDELSKSRDAFKLGFGGYPQLLPPASLCIPNPLLRQCLRLALLFPFVRNKLRHLL
jgi:lipid II:glycine glycyltransferase (peptidoglycan interpeptide bridge formation enzyme)